MMNEESISLLRVGNMKAWHDFYVNYYARVRGFVSRMVPVSWAADEITQTVFVRIWMNKERLLPGKSQGDMISGYVFAIARNEVNNWYRSRESFSSFRTKVIGELSGYGEDHICDLTDTRALIKTLDKAVSGMPDTRRKVFVQSRWHGMPNARIAEKMGISVRTVEKHIELALKYLRGQLSDFVK